MVDKPTVTAPECEFDHTSSDQVKDPYPLYASLRGRCPVVHSAKHGGFYPVLNYDGVKRVFSEYETFSSARGVGVPPQAFLMYPIDLDPPEQTRLRKLLNPLFTVERLAGFKDRIQSLLDGLIDGFIERGEAELGEELIRPLLASVVLPILGVPVEDRERVGQWIDTLARERGRDEDAVAAAGGAMIGYLTQLSASRRGGPMGDDVLSLLLKTSFDGEPLSDDYNWRVLVITLLGGLDTTSAVMMEALRHLSAHPEQAAALLSGELAWEPAIEEFIRHTSPVQALGRLVAHDTTLEGVALKRDEWVMGVLGSANRDPAHFKDPDSIDLTRAGNDHLAFGSGAHICLGRNLARLELRIFLETMLRRLPDLKPDPNLALDYSTGEARGLKSLPVTFTPGRRLSSAA